eukprot:754695-Hanusia_phi.AAC.2
MSDRAAATESKPAPAPAAAPAAAKPGCLLTDMLWQRQRQGVTIGCVSFLSETLGNNGHQGKGSSSFGTSFGASSAAPTFSFASSGGFGSSSAADKTSTPEKVFDSMARQRLPDVAAKNPSAVLTTPSKTETPTNQGSASKVEAGVPVVHDVILLMRSHVSFHSRRIVPVQTWTFPHLDKKSLLSAANEVGLPDDSNDEVLIFLVFESTRFLNQETSQDGEDDVLDMLATDLSLEKAPAPTAVQSSTPASEKKVAPISSGAPSR